MQIKKWVVLFFLVVSFSGMAQMERDLAGVDYINIKNGNAENGVGFERYNFRFTLPKRLKTEGSVLLNKIDFSRTNISYDIVPDLGGEIEQFNSITYTLGYVRPIKNDWTIVVMLSPNISSNFESNIKLKDVNLFSMLMFSKRLKPNLKLNLGMRYATTLGRPFPLPMFSMMWKANDKWTFNLGFPRIDAQYQLSKRTLISTDLFMAGDNFSLSDDLYHNEAKIDNISMMNVGGGVKISQKLTKFLKLNLSSGYTFYRKFQFSDGNDSVIDYNLDNNLYLKVGLSIGR